jgi:hypothetical protein
MSKTRISRTILLAAIVGCLMLAIPAPAAAGVRVGVGFYGGYYGPFFPYGYYPYGYWAPYGYPYYYAPYPYPPYGRPLGEVQIKSPEGDAQIFINGSFAGRAHDLKRFYLAPGNYTIEQRYKNDTQSHNIYVVANRSLKVEFVKPSNSRAPAPPPNPEPAAAPAGSIPPSMM